MRRTGKPSQSKSSRGSSDDAKPQRIASLIAREHAAAIVESSGDAITAIDRTDRFIAWNKGAERLFGYTAAEAIGQPVSILIPADRVAELASHLKEMRRGKQIVAFETVRLRKGGERRDVAITISPVRSADGTIIGSSGLFRDITDRKRAQEALRASEERYRTMFDSMLEGFCIIEMLFDARQRPVDYRFLEVNPAFVQQTGLADAQGKRMRELAPDHEAHWFEIYGKVALTGEPARFENEAKALRRWFEVSAYRVGDQASRKVAILFNDITERHRLELLARRAKEEWERTFDAIPDLICILDNNHNILRANRAMAKKLGVPPPEAVGLICFQCVHGLASVPKFCPHQQVLQDQQPHAAIVHEDRLGGDFHVSCTPLFDDAGRLLGSVHVARDITERMRLEAEIQCVSETEKQRLGRDLHDGLSQQLTGVRMLATALETALSQKGLPEAADAGQIVRELLAAAQQTHDLARGLFPVMLQRGQIVPALEELATATARRFKVTCRVVAPREIHFADTDAARQLYRIAQEAINNAIKHSHGKQIEVRLVAERGRIILTVRDDGVGISKKAVERSDMGLRIMQYRAGILHAQLKIGRAPGGGTLVTCSLAHPAAKPLPECQP